LKTSSLAWGSLIWGGALSSCSLGGARKPNFLVILMDDMGFSDAGCYGGEIRTPHIDALASNGIRFTNAYNAGRCWPSRACMITGYYPQQIRRDEMPGIKMAARPSWAHGIPEYLKPLHYRSYLSGKWHIDRPPEVAGFDRVFSYDDTDHHFLSTERMQGDENQPINPSDPEGYYASAAVADHAIRYLDEHARDHSEKPFFCYLALTEPHFPLQAPQKEIERYRDRYLEGWDSIRQARWKKLQKSGIVQSPLSAPDPDIVFPWNLKRAKLKEKFGQGEVDKAVPWESLTEEEKHFQANKMAIHAAMIERADREIGRVIGQLKRMNVYDNTVIIFASDNGASAEQMIRGDGHDPAAPMGSPKSYLSLGPGWSTAANTPFRLHKSWMHEGGISTPLIVHWPQGISARGELRHDPVHFVDVLPTVLDLARSPIRPLQSEAPPLAGVSLVPSWKNKPVSRQDALWWCHRGNRAIRKGKWKMVTLGDGEWALYDLDKDRGEMNDLTTQHPEIVKELKTAWERKGQSFIERLKNEPEISTPSSGGSHH